MIEPRVTEFDSERVALAAFAHFRHCKQCRDGGYEFGPIGNLCAQGQRMRRVAELTEVAWRSQNVPYPKVWIQLLAGGKLLWDRKPTHLRGGPGWGIAANREIVEWRFPRTSWLVPRSAREKKVDGVAVFARKQGGRRLTTVRLSCPTLLFQGDKFGFAAGDLHIEF